jgi:transposase
MGLTMNPVQYYVGIDVSQDTFTCSIFTTPESSIISLNDITNDPSGFERLESWLIHNQVSTSNCVICLEATGVYGESLSYWLAAKGYQVAVEPPLKVKRASSDKSHKNDHVDSKKISEYAYRYFDELTIWRPKSELVEQIKVLIMTREQLVKQKTTLNNTLKALKKKVVQTPFANKIYENNIDLLKKQIKQIEKELKKLIDNHPDFKNTVRFLDSITGVGFLLAVNFLVVTNGFENELAIQYRKAAAFIGVCPYEHRSGSSVYKRSRIPKYGPSILRKLLHLAARSVITHNDNFHRYFMFKLAQGKTKKQIINNVANKLLKIMCAIIRNQRPFIENYVSIHPKFALINN